MTPVFDPISSWFVAFAVYTFCIAYYARINPDFAMWLIERAKEQEEQRQKLREERKRDDR